MRSPFLFLHPTVKTQAYDPTPTAIAIAIPGGSLLAPLSTLQPRFLPPSHTFIVPPKGFAPHLLEREQVVEVSILSTRCRRIKMARDILLVRRRRNPRLCQSIIR